MSSLLTHRLSNAIAAPRDLVRLRALAREYVVACEEVNRRLGQCALLLQQNRVAEAQHLAQQVPPLLPLAESLNWPDCHRWQRFAEANQLPLPSPLRIDLIAKLRSPTSSPRSGLGPPPLPGAEQFEKFIPAPTRPAPTHAASSARFSTRPLLAGSLVAIILALLSLLFYALRGGSADSATLPEPVAETTPVPLTPADLDPEEVNPTRLGEDSNDLDEEELDLSRTERASTPAARPTTSTNSETVPEPTKPDSVPLAEPTPQSPVSPPVPATTDPIQATDFPFYPYPERSVVANAASVFGAPKDGSDQPQGVLYTAAVPVPDRLQLLCGSELHLQSLPEQTGTWELRGPAGAVANLRCVMRGNEHSLCFTWDAEMVVNSKVTDEVLHGAVRVVWGEQSFCFPFSKPQQLPPLSLGDGFSGSLRIAMTDTEVVLGDVHSPDYSGEYAAQNSVDYKRDERVSIQCELKPITMRGAEEAGYSCTARLMLDTGEDLREFRQRFVSLRRLREELAAFASLEAEKGKLQLEIARLLVVDASLEMKREMVARATELEAVEAAFAKRSRNKDILEDPGLFKSLETLSQKWQAVGLPKVSFTLYRLLKDPATGRTVGVPLQVYGEHRSSVQFMEPL